MQYEGTLILISHDRAFLDNVVTSTLVFEGNAHVNEYVGGYEDWLRQFKNKIVRKKNKKEKQVKTEVKSEEQKKTVKKRTFKEQKELEELPVLIEALDTEMAEITEKMADTKFYQQNKEIIAITTDRVTEIECSLKQAYERWEQLEDTQ